MRKLRVHPSILLLVALCLIFNRFVLLFNYLSALFLHEMAHVFVATRRGYELKMIRLNVFGISVELDEDVSDRDSFAVNIAGPILNLLLCLVCMSLYWIFPKSIQYLNVFCMSNLTIALFNLLPIYPLDGGKIFRSLFHSEKTYGIFNMCVRVFLTSLFIVLFIYSLNLFLLIFALFFAIPTGEKESTFSIFKNKHDRRNTRVNLIKVNSDDTLISLIKIIKKHHYTLFYIPNLNKFINEDMLVNLTLNNSITSKIRDII